jgi:hypothetical protein
VHLVRLAALTSTALDALAQLHLPDYRRKVARRPTVLKEFLARASDRGVCGGFDAKADRV